MRAFACPRHLALLPEIVGLIRSCRGRQYDLAARAGGFIRREQDLEYRLAVCSRHHRLPVVPDAIDEMLELLRKAVVPDLLIPHDTPSNRAAGLLPRVPHALR